MVLGLADQPVGEIGLQTGGQGRRAVPTATAVGKEPKP